MRFSQRWKFLMQGGALALLMTAWAVSGAGADPPTAAEGERSAAAMSVGGAQYANILTNHNDNARTGANLVETALKVSNVKPAYGTASGFGKLFTRKVDGQMYAQPLYVSQLTIGGRKRNVVFVATMHNSVYAFDADDLTASAPLWKTAFLNDAKGIYACPIWEVGGWDTNIYPEVGIVSTPVIDLSTFTLYCTSKTKDVAADGTVTYPTRLRALNIITGAERVPGGIKIAATVAGTGDGANGDGTLTFDPARHQNRPGLLLNRGVLYIAFGAHSDITPYHGWVFAYDAATLNKIDVWCSTPNGKTDPSGYPLGGGGIWQSGHGLVADSLGNIYFEIGNGTFSADQGGQDYGDSFVKLKLVNKKLTVQDYFTPYNQDLLNRVDADLGVTGPTLVPGTNFLVGGGKAGIIYVVDAQKMGGFNPDGDTQIRQWFRSYPQHLHGAPVYWDGPDGPAIYFWAEYVRLKAFRFNKQTRKFVTDPFAVSAMDAPPGMPGAALSVSANGATDGIIWACLPYDDDAIHKIVPGVVRAFDARNLTELWNSKMVPERDDIGMLAKFTPPTIANGKVYVASFSNELAVYGINKWAITPTITPASGEYLASKGPVTVTISSATPGVAIYYTVDGSEPTTASLRYTASFKLSQSTVVKSKAFATGFLPSGVALAKYLIDNGPGNGDGLLGSYSNGIDFAGPFQTRVDPIINFRGIGGQEPLKGIGPDYWCARWTGKVLPRATGLYTFTTGSDDGVRLWVNGQLLVDNWTYHGYTENSGAIVLQQGVKYDVRLEFFQGWGGADIALYWQSDFFDKQVIPQSQLFSK